MSQNSPSLTQPRRRVVITGIGAVTPVGNTAPATWSALAAGQSGIARITRFDPTACSSSAPWKMITVNLD